MSCEGDRTSRVNSAEALSKCISALFDLNDDERHEVIEALCSFYALNPSPRLADLSRAFGDLLGKIPPDFVSAIMEMITARHQAAEPAAYGPYPPPAPPPPEPED